MIHLQLSCNTYILHSYSCMFIDSFFQALEKNEGGCYDIYEHTCARAPNPYRYTHRTYLSDEQQSLCPIFRVLDCKLIERSVLCQP